MAVELKICIGIADICMGVGIDRIHFQFLIQVAAGNSQLLKQILERMRIGLGVRHRKILSDFPYLG